MQGTPPSVSSDVLFVPTYMYRLQYTRRFFWLHACAIDDSVNYTRAQAGSATAIRSALSCPSRPGSVCDKVPLFAGQQFVVTQRWEESNLHGIPDLSFAGSPSMLEYVFNTLYARFKAREVISNDTRAHFMIQFHLNDLLFTVT